jgi:hypothetical protein
MPDLTGCPRGKFIHLILPGVGHYLKGLVVNVKPIDLQPQLVLAST